MQEKIFTRYQVFVIVILTILQFTIVLDFMVLSPLGAILMPTLHITPRQFGMVVSAYAFSAGTSGLLSAFFADKFDRKKLLLLFYSGFVFGTFLCGIAPTYEFLLGARIITGIFGGVIGSVSFAIITDLFKFEVRGRVMGFFQMAFASSQVLGLPIGLYLANHMGWHSPFIMIVALSVIVGVLMISYLQPIDAHLHQKSDRNTFVHLGKIISNPDYLRAFIATTLLATGGFMLMPFGSAFSVNNLKISLDSLPLLYMVTGAFSMFMGPLAGKLSDQYGKYPVFFVGSVIAIVTVLVYCGLGPTPLWTVMIISVIMFTGITSRMVSSSALVSGIPAPTDRGAFMSINSAVQQISGGIATFIAGLIVSQAADGTMQNYPMLGYVVTGTTLFTMVMMYIVNQDLMRKNLATASVAPKLQ
jgi:predicted MFS family arabinose efflux permease